MDDFNILQIEKEDKTLEHYSFLSSAFNDIYINENDFMTRDDLFVVCLRNDDDELIAISLCRLGVSKIKKTLISRVIYVFVGKRYRGNNINLNLNLFIQKYSKSIGCKKIVCNIKANNSSSIITFLKSGFVISNKNPISYKDGTKKLFLIKKL